MIHDSMYHHDSSYSVPTKEGPPCVCKCVIMSCVESCCVVFWLFLAAERVSADHFRPPTLPLSLLCESVHQSGESTEIGSQTFINTSFSLKSRHGRCVWWKQGTISYNYFAFFIYYYLFVQVQVRPPERGVFALDHGKLQVLNPFLFFKIICSQTASVSQI